MICCHALGAATFPSLKEPLCNVRFGSLADISQCNRACPLLPPKAEILRPAIETDAKGQSGHSVAIYAALQCLCSIDVPRPSAQLLGLVTSLDERQRDFVAIGTTVKQVGTSPKYECALLSLFSCRICHFR